MSVDVQNTRPHTFSIRSIFLSPFCPELFLDVGLADQISWFGDCFQGGKFVLYCDLWLKFVKSWQVYANIIMIFFSLWVTGWLAVSSELHPSWPHRRTEISEETPFPNIRREGSFPSGTHTMAAMRTANHSGRQNWPRPHLSWQS